MKGSISLIRVEIMRKEGKIFRRITKYWKW